MCCFFAGLPSGRCHVYSGPPVKKYVCHRLPPGFDEESGLAYDFLQKPRAAAVADWLGGDETAMARAERRAAKLVARWPVTCAVFTHARPVDGVIVTVGSR